MDPAGQPRPVSPDDWQEVSLDDARPVSPEEPPPPVPVPGKQSPEPVTTAAAHEEAEHHAAAEGASMPTIDENKTLPAGQLHGMTSMATLSPPGTSGANMLSTQASTATLVPPYTATSDGPAITAKGSEATLIPAKASAVALPVAAALPAAPAAGGAAAIAMPPAPPGEKKNKNPFHMKDETKTKFKDFWVKDALFKLRRNPN
jgi:hypothetical protein